MRYEEIRGLVFYKFREIVRNFCEMNLEGIMDLLPGKIPELFLQWTVQREMKITLSEYEASLHKQWLSHELTCRRLTMMPLKYQVPDTVLFYKNRAIAVIVRLKMTLSDALQDDFLTLD